MTRNSASRGALVAAGIILLGTAVMHATGYRPLVEQLSGASVRPEWLAGVKGLWLAFSLHLSIVGFLFLSTMPGNPGAARAGEGTSGEYHHPVAGSCCVLVQSSRPFGGAEMRVTR